MNLLPPSSGLKSEPSKKQAANRALPAACFLLVCCLAHSVTLKMEAVNSSKTLMDFCGTAQCDIPEDITL
jgi:hypothetical protein